MTTGNRGDHLARLQGELKRTNDRIYDLERRLGVKQTDLRPDTSTLRRRFIGDSGQPGFENNWFPIHGHKSWYAKDGFGYVHLGGIVRHSPDFRGGFGLGQCFTLPAGYRPVLNTGVDSGFEYEKFTVVSHDNTLSNDPAFSLGTLGVYADGRVSPITGETHLFMLYGVSFYAG